MGQKNQEEKRFDCHRCKINENSSVAVSAQGYLSTPRQAKTQPKHDQLSPIHLGMILVLMPANSQVFIFLFQKFFSMKFQFLSKTAQHKRFDFSPMYYDERKERLELKKKEFKVLENEELSADDRKSILRNNMQNTWTRSKQFNKQKQSANYRVLLLIGILLALGYFIFNGVNEVDTVVKKLW